MIINSFGNRKSFRKIRKQKAGNANLITAAAALASTAALGAGFYYNRKRINKKKRDTKKNLREIHAIIMDDSSDFSDSD